jgi:predicted DCC family thiol-disulfide oxidoreductase YuxK
MKIFSFVRRSYDKKIDGTGLAIFRIAYCIVLLCEIAQMYYFRHLIFDPLPFLLLPEIRFSFPIMIWFISVVFLLFGAFTRFFAVLNYLMGLILIGTIGQFEYHVFYAYMGMNFLFIFLPVSQTLSLDRLIKKLKYSNTTFSYNPSKEVRQIYYFIPSFVGVGIVYFDSIFYKLSSGMWMDGLGSWLPSSLPMITHVSNSWLLNQEFLIRGIGWYTVIFETIYLFIFFRKRWRVFTLISGLILHLGILLQFPIPWFALTVVALYLLLVPVSFWKKIFSFRKKSPSLVFYYDAECPLCVRTKIIISHLDSFGRIDFKTVQANADQDPQLKEIGYQAMLDNIYSRNLKGKIFVGLDTYIQVFARIFYLWPLSLILRIPGIYHLAAAVYSFIADNRNTERCTEENCGYNPPNIVTEDNVKVMRNFTLSDLKYKLLVVFIVFVTITQALMIYNSWSMQYLRERFYVYNTAPDKFVANLIYNYESHTKVFLGLTSHPVFSERIHFDRYNHIVAVTYIDKKGTEIWLPIIDKNGQPDLYNYGSNWVNWTFRVNQLDIHMGRLNNGLKRYTAFWAGKHGVDLMDATFRVKVKKIETTQHWEKDFLDRQKAKPWVDAGLIHWENNGYKSEIVDIEGI